MTTRSVDNYQSIENISDVQDVLLESSTIYPSNVTNNVPNSVNVTGGEIPIWNGTKWSLQGDTSLGIGLGDGLFNQGNNCVALGHNAGRNDQYNNAISICHNAGNLLQATSAIAIGQLAGNENQGRNSIAIGLSSGEIAQGDNSIAIGYRAGTFSQEMNSIAIGYNSGLTQQPDNSIVMNSSAAIVNGITSSAFYVSPIRNVVTNSLTNDFLCYDDTNKEVVQASNIEFVNPISISSGSVSTCGIQFSGDSNTGFYSSALDTIEIATGGSQRISINNNRTFINQQILGSTGSSSAPSFSFEGNNTTGLYSGGSGSNTIKLSTNGTERLSVDTTGFNFLHPIKLATTGGTPTSFDYYERTTQIMIMRYSNSATFNWTITLIRIGTYIEYHFPEDANLYTISNGPRSIDSETNTIPSRFRPSSNQAFPYIYLTGGFNWTMGKIIINTNGNLSISPLNAQFQTNDTIYIQRQSNSVFI